MKQLRNLIGKRWAVPCNPPLTFDCWELVRVVREMAERPTPTYVERAQRLPSDRRMMISPPTDWGALVHPEPWCVVRMNKGKHVGVLLDGCRQVIHCDMFSGVRVDNLTDLRRQDELTFWELRNA